MRFSPLLSKTPVHFLVALAALGLRLHAETIWWEAEAAKETNMEVQPEETGALSGGKWLTGPVSEGLFAEYDVNAAEGGHYSFLARRFWLHGAFRWRFDDGNWYSVQGTKQTILDKQQWTKGPLCWTDLGYVTLKPGAHKLRIELLTNTTFEFNKIYSFDCFVLSNDGFVPLGTKREGGPKQAAYKEDEANFGRHLPRTMSLLQSATPEHHTPVYILCYGQSIVANSHIDSVLAKVLREKYPNVQLKIKNLAIGGYQAPLLRRTAWQDLYPENPDLIVFHDYGGETGELEEIYKGIKSYMTAEVLTWTHHVDNFGAGIDQQRDVSSEFLKTLAAKYGWEMSDVRWHWKEYLKETHMEAADLLVDRQIHLNGKGTELLKECLVPHFRANPEASDDWKKKVLTLPLSQPAQGVTCENGSWAQSKDGLSSTGTKPLRVEFVGNRVDLIAFPGSTGSASILLDGTKPSLIRDTLAVRRSTVAPGGWWPVISRVHLNENAVVEKYTMQFHDVAPDGSSFSFDVTGSVSGSEGSGKSGADFIARSGHFSIKAEDIALASVKKITKKDLPPQLTVEWDVYSMSRDVWKSPAKLKPGEVPQETVIRCWNDGHHVLEITPDGGGVVSLKEIMVFSPGGGKPDHVNETATLVP